MQELRIPIVAGIQVLQQLRSATGEAESAIDGVVEASLARRHPCCNHRPICFGCGFAPIRHRARPANRHRHVLPTQ